MLGETDPELAHFFTRPRHRRGAAARRRLRCPRRTCSPSAAGSSTSTRRRAAYDDVLLPLHGAHQADNAAIALAAAEAFVGAPLDPRSRRRRVGARRVAGPARGRAAPTARPARRRAQRRRRGGAARRPRRRVRDRAAHAGRRVPPGEGSARDARRAGHRRSRAASSAAGRRAARALDPERSWPRPPSNSGFPRSRSRSWRPSSEAVTAALLADAGGRPDRDHRLALRRRRGPVAARPTLTENAARDGRPAHRRHRGQRHRQSRISASLRAVASDRPPARCATSTTARAEKTGADFDASRVHRPGRDVRERRRSTRSSWRHRPGPTADSPRRARRRACTCTARSRSRPPPTRATRSPATHGERSACRRSASSSASTRATSPLREAVATLGPLRRVSSCRATNWFRAAAVLRRPARGARPGHGGRRRADEPGDAPGRRTDRDRRHAVARARGACAARATAPRVEDDAIALLEWPIGRDRCARRVAQRPGRLRTIRVLRRPRRARARRRLRRAPSPNTTTRRQRPTSAPDEYPELMHEWEAVEVTRARHRMDRLSHRRRTATSRARSLDGRPAAGRRRGGHAERSSSRTRSTCRR